ncbi:Tyrosine kinase receptor Cad96Ca [Holothuria leucospilota]|uniref:Tyrosine kinase receptor Cad96Ca n=1 Tax=Holothuria leucospilota TaxID=206669 RepID=A0A9Q1BYU7_HOLLE|nr:Tyrosine kinase receptor Cad96Ca [Holothuria leucospilota]
MALKAEILFFLLPQILDTAADMTKPNQCFGGPSSSTTSTCKVAINETVCLVCNTSHTDKNAIWTLGNDTLVFRFRHAALEVEGSEFPDSYGIGCHNTSYSLNISRSRVPQNNTVYFCQASGNLLYGFNVTTVERQPTIKPEEHSKGSNGSTSHKSISSGLIALYVSVPCLFLSSILTSVLLYLKAKMMNVFYILFRTKKEDVVEESIQRETNHTGTGRVYSDIIEEDTTPKENLANLANLPKTFEAVLNTRLKTSGIFEYWSATYVAESSEDQSCFAKTLSSLATMKDAKTFQEHAMNLKTLKNSNFLVQLLCVSVDELPYAIYYEYMECGTLRDFMLRRYQQARKSRMSLSIGNPEILPANVKSQIEELLTFASMIAEALKFITSQKFSHPALSLKKVLLSEYCECKLYDIYPTEMSLTRITYLMGKDDPPVAWMAVETIFLQEYQTSSDVWSFAVLLWELFSLGDVPFARNTREEIEQKIRDGVVLTQPLCCPGAIYGIMLSCWNNSARKRPTCEILLHKIRNMVEKFKERDRNLPTVSEVPEMPYFVLDRNEAHNNYI